MSLKPLTLPNIIQIKNDYPGVHEDLQKMQGHVNLILKALGGLADPVAAGGITVSASNGVVDVQIIDKHPEIGEEYFLEYDTQPSFVNAHPVPLGAVRNYRNSTLAGQTTYWRWYKSTKLGGISERITYGGTSPTGVTPGNLSTSSPGPAPSTTQGSGKSQQPGFGYGSSDSRLFGARTVF